jgi:hypothetical protein
MLHALAEASVFESFLLGLSTLARDGVLQDTMDASITQVLQLWRSPEADESSR